MAEIIHDGVKYSTFYGAIITDDLEDEMKLRFPSDIPGLIDQEVYFKAREKAKECSTGNIDVVDVNGVEHSVFVIKREHFPK